MIIDQQYRDWYRHTNNVIIPEDCGIKVNRILQGHLESPQLWVTLINKHIRVMGPNYKRKEIYFLRQVDDFAVSCIDETIINDVITCIDQKMTIKIKLLDVLKDLR